MSAKQIPAWWEPVAIAVVLCCLSLPLISWPGQTPAGQVLLILAVVFLAQTLIRDLLILAMNRDDRGGENGQHRQEAQVFCLESGVGVLIVVLGIILLVAGSGGNILLSPWQWLMVTAAVLLTNYLLRDYVFSWNPWRIYRDPDHMNIIPRLRKPSV